MSEQIGLSSTFIATAAPRSQEVLRLTRQWIVFGLAAGLLGDLAFFASSVLGAVQVEPTRLGFLVGLPIGPGITLGFIGLYFFIKQQKNSAVLQAATLFGVIGGVLINAMLVVQMALALRFGEAVQTSPGIFSWTVQMALDVSWDVYFTLAMILLGAAMWSHPRLGPIYGAITVLIGALLLAFNVATFPVPPANDGLVDLGPLSGAWFAILSLRVLTSLRWLDEQTT